MKFHCDRCKTKYSIADERVRGKILKIRCKNCSAVITVREGMDVSAAKVAAPAIPARAKRASSGGSGRSVRPSTGQSSALRGAFQQVIAQPQARAEPSASDSFAAPATLEEEWYVSIDGDQSGPFNLTEARDWVAGHGVDEDLYCWSEGFDDWLPTEKVSHFRGLRSRPDTIPSRLPSVTAPSLAAAPRIPQSENTPQPLFAAALAALEAETTADLPQATANASVLALPPLALPPLARPPIPSNGSHAASLDGAFAGLLNRIPEADPDPSPRADAALDDMDLDIGEVSRVVKLPNLAALRDTGAAGPMSPAGLPGMGGGLGRGTGSVASIRQAQVAAGLPLTPLSDSALADAQPAVLSAEKRKDKLVLYIIGGVAALAVVGLVVFMLVTSGGGERRVSNRDYGDDGVERLGYRFENPNLAGGDDDDDDTTPDDVTPEDVAKTTTSNRQTRDSTPTNRSGNNTTSKDTTNTNDTSNGKVEVVPGNDDPTLMALSPMDVTRVASNMTTGRRCYERALKKDPFLSVSKLYVTMTINTEGVVTNVTLSTMANTFLGECLIAGVRKWQFRKSSKGLTTQISLVFEQK